MRSFILIIVLIFVSAFGAFGAVSWQLKYYQNLERGMLASLNTPHQSAFNEHVVSATSQTFELVAGDQVVSVPASFLRTWLVDYFRPYTQRQEYSINHDMIVSYMKDLAPQFIIEPVNARLAIQDGIVAESTPARFGQTLNIEESARAIARAMARGDHGTNLAVDAQEPELTAAKAAAMGITTILSQGTSIFTGSIPARIHNIRTGAGTLNGILVRTGEEFSFNTMIGEVSARTGYMAGFVIKGTQLIPEYGGGICQVSTTLFRAAILAGLPITERRAHSLPVRYYNPQGFDATVYPGITDLKFINDTPAPILIQSRVTGVTLYFEIFGSSDGRSVSLNGPRQYDVQPDGSLKAVLTRTITYANNTQKTDSFYSSYKAPGLFETIRNPLE